MNAINPILRHLGFLPDDRVVVVHADDLGMCHATLPAIDELMAFGLVTSASAMVPCPWFPEVVAWHRRCPQFDLGIHLTLTSEWDRYRWGPVSTHAGIDRVGGRPGVLSMVRSRRYASSARPESVDRRDSMPGRPRRAAPGLQVYAYPTRTCSCYYASNSLILYLEIACERRLPAFLMRTPGRRRERAGLGPTTRPSRWQERGQPVFDHWRVVTRRGCADDHDAFVRDVFDQLPAGLSCVLLHPAIDTPEIRQITGDWRGRVADYERIPSAHRLRVHLHEPEGFN